MGYVFRYQEYKMSALEKLRVAAGTEKLAALRLRYMTSNNTDNFSEADLRELANSSFDIQNVLPIIMMIMLRISQETSEILRQRYLT